MWFNNREVASSSRIDRYFYFIFLQFGSHFLTINQRRLLSDHFMILFDYGSFH